MPRPVRRLTPRRPRVDEGGPYLLADYLNAQAAHLENMARKPGLDAETAATCLGQAAVLRRRAATAGRTPATAAQCAWLDAWRRPPTTAPSHER